MIRYACKYTPVELLAGFGLQSGRLNPTAARTQTADRLTHPNLCGFSRALLQDCRGGEDLLLVNCCDALRRVYDVLDAQGGTGFRFCMDLPREDGPCARARLAAELRRLLEACARFTGRDFDMAACLAAFAPPAPQPSGPHLALLGARAEQELLAMLQKELPLPLRDGSCLGNRCLPQPPAGMGLDAFLDWYAGALLAQLPCMRMAQVGPRRALLEAPGLCGIVYHTVKFCDFYDFAYAALQKETKLPLLKLETDYSGNALGQLRTRVQAFAETLVPQKPRCAAKARYAAGIDSGSATTDVVILDGQARLLGSAIVPTGARAASSAQRAMELALQQAGLRREQLDAVVGTGYGRAAVGAGSGEVTEISCHAKGAHFLAPEVRTILDIGGQDSKAIRVDENGAVLGFVMNDKCAAGTGRFLEMMARTLELDMAQMSRAGLHWREDLPISSMCTVFAESEVVSLVAQNKRTADIVHGLNCAVADKAVALLARVQPQARYMMTGGVAGNAGVVRAVEEKLGQKLLVPPQHQLCGALGAALLALGRCV